MTAPTREPVGQEWDFNPLSADVLHGAVARPELLLPSERERFALELLAARARLVALVEAIEQHEGDTALHPQTCDAINAIRAHVQRLKEDE